MIPLILSITCSTLIFVIFKLFERFKIDTFQAIVFNYFTAFICGISLYGNEWTPEAMNDTTWIYFAIICAILFISLFFLMGTSSQKNGVAITSVAVKMSMAFSILLMILLYSEDVTLLKLSGIVLAFLGIYLVSSPSKSGQRSSALWMLAVLFIGSGFLDFSINYIQKSVLIELTPSVFSAISLGMAGVLGSLFLMLKFIRKQSTFAFKNVIAGLVLGVPNYFSIYLLMRSYKSTGWADSTVLAVTNVSVVLFSAIIGFIIFKEQSTVKKLLGLAAVLEYYQRIKT
jgi:drug/metabolite transporter (DMT)-like permease